MQVLIFPSRDEATRAAAKRIADRIVGHLDIVLGLATGGTMEPVYARLIEIVREGGIDVSRASSFNLDEYVGLAADHPQSYATTMRRLLFDHLPFDPERTRLPRGDAPDPLREAKLYEAMIAAAGGVELQLLGLGNNGHIGFNEPSSSLASRTRIKRLTRNTIEANQRFFGPDETVPTHSITMGIATIMEAREVMLVATGAAKAEAVAAMIEGPVSAACPASALQYHPRAAIMLDPDAAAGLKLRDYYEDVHPGGREVYFARR